VAGAESGSDKSGGAKKSCFLISKGQNYVNTFSPIHCKKSKLETISLELKTGFNFSTHTMQFLNRKNLKIKTSVFIALYD